MALRFDASTDELGRVTNVPVIPLTAMCWVKISTDTNNYATFIQAGGLNDAPSYILQTDANGTTFSIWNGGAQIAGSAMSVGVWAHVCMVIAGTGASQLLGYLNNVLDVTTSGNNTVDKMRLGNSRGVEPLNGCIAAYKEWTGVALTQAQIAIEMRYYTPRFLTGLNAWSPLRDTGEQTIDYSGKGSTWTVGGTLATENGPPIVWAPRHRHGFFTTGGAVITPVSLSSSVTPVSSLIKVPSKRVSSSVIPATTMIKRVNKSVSSSMVPVSSVNKRVNKALLSSVTPVSALLRRVNKVLTSSVVPVSSLTKFMSKSMSSAALIGSSLSKSVNKGVFNSNITPVSSIVKRVNKSLSSAVTPVSSVVTSVIKVLMLSSSVVPVSSMVKVVSKGLSSVVVPSSSMLRVISKNLSSVVVPVSGIVKGVNKILSSVVVPTTSLIPSAIKMLVLTSFITPVSSLSKVVVKGLSSSVVVITMISKIISKGLSSSVIPTTMLVKMYLQYLVLDSFVVPVSSIVSSYISGTGLPSLNSMYPLFRRRSK